MVLEATRRRGKTRRDGVAVAVLAAFDEVTGQPLVALAGTADPAPARSTIELGVADQGCEVVVMFEDGDLARPIVVGRLCQPMAPAAIKVLGDNERVEITAHREIVLACGKASIVLTRAGKILIRGTHLVSRSSGANKIKGGSVQLN